MQIQDRSQIKIDSQLQSAITASQNYLFSLQESQGYWHGELESNVTITAEAVLLHKIWQTDHQRPLHKAENYLRQQQRDHGGWELFYGDGGDLSTTVEAYMALRLLGVAKEDPALLKAKTFILKKGGISKTRIFTKLHLALIGCYDWKGVPSIPPWLMLFPDNFPVTIYEMSSWARSSTVPLIIVCDRKPVYNVNPQINLHELYVENIENIDYSFPRQGDWTDLFITLDNLFKLSEQFNVVPFREQGLKLAEKWVLERQEDSGDWGGIIPAMLNSLLALKALNYDVKDPVVERGLKSVDNFAIETEDNYVVQACVSPVWDTAWALRALVASGIPKDHPALIKGADWLLDQQILDYGDWQVKNKEGTPGGWAFEFNNRFYPDLDDSAVVVMALNDVKMPQEALKTGAMDRCVKWMATMQCKEGGWAAFDINNDQDWLNLLPYADLKAMIDPNTADVTARVLEMVGSTEVTMDQSRLEKAIAYLIKEQEKDGSWFGRWGVNYIYGTSGALAALEWLKPQDYHNLTQSKRQEMMEKGAQWLITVQNDDGGWGETCDSYKDVSLKGKGISTASQTAWALIGLLGVKEFMTPNLEGAIKRGVNYLISTQKEDGKWDESQFTGTGFPCHFYLKYHLYQQYFPLLALGYYQKYNNQKELI
jgi:squalene-hopene/tetraprenyl-beta-curcumene cyclase